MSPAAPDQDGPIPWHACASIVERHDPVRFAATMAGPLDARAALFPIYAFNCEIARAPWVTAEPLLAEMRLQWWADALDEISSGGHVRAHEVTSPLAEVLNAAQAQALQICVDARRRDAHNETFETVTAFRGYIQDTAVPIMAVSVSVLGGPSDQVTDELAYAAGLAAYFQAVPQLEARGRAPLVDGGPHAIAALAENALAGLTRFDRHALPSACWPALLPAFQARTLLRKAAKDPGRVAQGRLLMSPFARTWRLMHARRARF